MTQKPHLTETLTSVRKELNSLATEDVSTVVRDLGAFIEKNVTDSPYLAVATAIGIGFGLTALNRSHLKSSAIRLGKLVAMRGLSNLDTQSNPTPQGESHGNPQIQTQLPA